jgi:hypothetical protein
MRLQLDQVAPLAKHGAKEAQLIFKPSASNKNDWRDCLFFNTN